MKYWREIPPTSGLPTRLGDLLRSSSRSLETNLAEFLGTDSIQIECSGTAALYVALESLKKLSPRKKVVISAYTCPLVLLAIRRAGLEVVICDTQLDHFDFDFEMLSKLCNQETLAVINVHLAGIPSDSQRALAVTRSVGAFLIEDAAQAMGALQNGKSIGTLGDYSIYSLAVGKGLTMFEGGVLRSSSDEFRTLAQQTSAELIPLQSLKEIERCIELIGYTFLYNPIGLIWSYGAPRKRYLAKNDPVRAVGDFFEEHFPLHRPGEYRKRVAANSFERLNKWIEENRARAKSRVDSLKQIPGIFVLEPAVSDLGTYPFHLMLTKNQDISEAILDKLWASPLGVSKLFVRSVNEYEYLTRHFTETSCPNAESFANRSFTISNSPLLSDREFQGIVEVLRETVSLYSK